MLIELAPLVLSMMVGWLRKGSLKRVSMLALRLPALALVSLVLQSLLIGLVNPTTPLFAPVYIFSFLLLGIFFAFNFRVPFLWLMAAGVFLNFAVIALNGGHMPVDSVAFSAIGAESTAIEHVAPVSEQTKLAFLGDVIPLWLGEGGRSGAYISAGDIVLAIGTFMFIQAAMLPSRRAPKHLLRRRKLLGSN